MRNLCLSVLSAGDSITTNGSQIDSNQLVSASFHAYFGDTNAAGTFKLQASNDPCAFGNLAQDFVVSHWVDVPSQSASIVAGASALLIIPNMTYRWIRAVYTNTATVQQTVTAVADVAGSLNSKYFLLNAKDNSVLYYVWINVSSGGVDPAIPGRTGVEVTISTGDTAATVATAIAAAIDLLTTFSSTAALAVATIVAATAGSVVPASDVNTGFTFAVTVGGSTAINVNMNALGI